MYSREGIFHTGISPLPPPEDFPPDDVIAVDNDEEGDQQEDGFEEVSGQLHEQDVVDQRLNLREPRLLRDGEVERGGGSLGHAAAVVVVVVSAVPPASSFVERRTTTLTFA